MTQREEREAIIKTIIIRPVKIVGKHRAQLRWRPEWEGPNPGCLREYLFAENAYKEAVQFIKSELYLD